MHGAVQIAIVTIISYKPLSDLNFNIGIHTTLLHLHALFSFGVYKPLDIQWPTISLCLAILAWQSLKNKVKPIGGHAQKLNVLVEVLIATIIYGDTYKFVMNCFELEKETNIVEITGVLQK